MRVTQTWQISEPVFVKYPFSADDKEWKRGERFNWLERNIEDYKVERLYQAGYLYHNPELEVVSKSGDRLNELGRKQLESLVRMLNHRIEKKTATNDEFKKKKVKASRLDDKQRTHIRMWRRRFDEFEQDFLEVREDVLARMSKPVKEESEEE